MNSREAAKALIDGKKIRGVKDAPDSYIEINASGRIVRADGSFWGTIEDFLTLYSPDVEFVEYVVPATDEELAAAFEARAKSFDGSEHRWMGEMIALVLKQAADMVRTRKVRSDWGRRSPRRPGNSG